MERLAETVAIGPALDRPAVSHSDSALSWSEMITLFTDAAALDGDQTVRP
ncbi:hypothetical protein GPX89_36760 [Nocardia sp. ET3-3]|uniref:Uncharacterized protein n=1 Tax=Nocardia terrae TaxID=2675851 RepID=A0A7K1V7Y9_9NOCA|nr:hypothetical protein [Nocardia terrae]MVU82774.1 hypothetical protein [Nocardia terrae]